MAIASVAASKLRDDLMEFLLSRLPVFTKEEQDNFLSQTQEEIDARMAPLRAKFDEIRNRYKPGTMIIIDALGNITTLDPGCSLLLTILEVVHSESHGRTDSCHFTV